MFRVMWNVRSSSDNDKKKSFSKHNERKQNEAANDYHQNISLEYSYIVYH